MCGGWRGLGWMLLHAHGFEKVEKIPILTFVLKISVSLAFVQIAYTLGNADTLRLNPVGF